MKMQDLENKKIRIGKTSITVKCKFSFAGLTFFFIHCIITEKNGRHIWTTSL